MNIAAELNKELHRLDGKDTPLRFHNYGDDVITLADIFRPPHVMGFKATRLQMLLDQLKKHQMRDLAYAPTDTRSQKQEAIIDFIWGIAAMTGAAMVPVSK